jgi:crotonobetainyl-CoA:carnitine CoA-transferase CaiB-like acyl-CoA transferase
MGKGFMQGRNRRCMTIDMHTEAGRELVRKLAGRVDVLIENFRPGVMEKWGLGPKASHASLPTPDA